MGKRNRQPRINTNVWLSPAVLFALEELGDGRKSFIAYRRTQAARYLLIETVDPAMRLRKAPADWSAAPKYLPERAEGEKLVRFPLRIHAGLLRVLEAKAAELQLSRSALVRKALTLAVNERLDLDYMDLSDTIRRYKIVLKQ